MTDVRADSAILIGAPHRMEGVTALTVQAATRLHQFPDVTSAVESGVDAELVVVIQNWSDEYSSQDIRQILERFSESRLIVVQGRWCLSDRRTRNAWPAAICVFEPDFPARLELELLVLAGRIAPLPWTAGLDEIFAFDNGMQTKKPS
jgi:hypothetical protein